MEKNVKKEQPVVIDHSIFEIHKDSKPHGTPEYPYRIQLYLQPGAPEDNKYDEYLYFLEEDRYEKIGSFTAEVDLSKYIEKKELYKFGDYLHEVIQSIESQHNLNKQLIDTVNSNYRNVSVEEGTDESGTYGILNIAKGSNIDQPENDQIFNEDPPYYTKNKILEQLV